MVGGLVVRCHNTHDIITAAHRGKQALVCVFCDVMIDVFGVQAANDLHVLLALTHGEEQLFVIFVDLEPVQVGEHLAVGHTGAGGEQILARFQLDTLLKVAAPGRLLGIGEQLQPSVYDTAQGEVDIVLRVVNIGRLEIVTQREFATGCNLSGLLLAEAHVVPPAFLVILQAAVHLVDSSGPA